MTGRMPWRNWYAPPRGSQWLDRVGSAPVPGVATFDTKEEAEITAASEMALLGQSVRYLGAGRRLPLTTDCKSCNGYGQVGDGGSHVCPDCGGSGEGDYEVFDANNQWRLDYNALAEERDALQSDNRRLRMVIERDRSIVATAEAGIARAIGQYWHLLEGRGSYEWDDDKWRDEFRDACKAIRTQAVPLRKIGGDRSDGLDNTADVMSARSFDTLVDKARDYLIRNVLEPHGNPDPLPTLLGVCTQVDHITATMIPKRDRELELVGAARETKAAINRLYHALIELAPEHPELHYAHGALVRVNEALSAYPPVNGLAKDTHE